MLLLPEESRESRRIGGVVLEFDMVRIDEGYSLLVVVFALVTINVAVVLLVSRLSVGLVPLMACVAAILAEARFSCDSGVGLVLLLQLLLLLLLFDRLSVCLTIVLCGLMLS